MCMICSWQPKYAISFMCHDQSKQGTEKTLSIYDRSVALPEPEPLPSSAIKGNNFSGVL